MRASWARRAACPSATAGSSATPRTRFPPVSRSTAFCPSAISNERAPKSSRWAPGGSTIALTWHLMQRSRGADRPSRIIVSNRSAARLEEIRAFTRELDSGVPTEYVLAPRPPTTTRCSRASSPDPSIINATGLGKDAPGSPLTRRRALSRAARSSGTSTIAAISFSSIRRARSAIERDLQIEDGWTYFLHGWTQVIAEVFHIDIPTSGPAFAALSEIAMRAAKE